MLVLDFGSGGFSCQIPDPWIFVLDLVLRFRRTVELRESTTNKRRRARGRRHSPPERVSGRPLPACTPTTLKQTRL